MYILGCQQIPWSVHSPEAKAINAISLDPATFTDDMVHESAKHALQQRRKYARWLDDDDPVVVANAIDTANLAQLLRKENQTLPMLAAEWAATEQLIELGGRAVQGLHVAQYFDRQGQQPGFLDFRKAFVARFGRQPGFAEVGAFDATRVVLQAERQRQGKESLRDTLRRLRRFDGLQQTIEFDDYGDASRQLYITRIDNGRYVVAA
jgi:branched-chain amino acid transport system substrate-binding protein